MGRLPPAMPDSSDPDALAETEAHGTGVPDSRERKQPLPMGADAPPRRLEHYTVLRREDGTTWELGRGAMGVTYKAFDTRLHCNVALKVIHAELLRERPVMRERFLREARIAASVRHPNIASVFHLGETKDGDCFFAMELVEGETLAEIVRRRGPLPALLALDIITQVAHVLVAAGQVDLIHRDLKPANIMLATGGPRSSRPGSAYAGNPADCPPCHPDPPEEGAPVKVIDFGLARSITVDSEAEPLTVVGDFLGTPQYASPEQLSGDDTPLDVRSDIFSLGSTLWFLLTGQHPFSGRSLAEIHRQQLRAPSQMQLVTARVPEPVATLLGSMLAPNPDHRPQTPFALIEAVRQCREQIQSTRQSAVGSAADARKGRWPRWAIALAAVLVLLSIGGAGIWFLRPGAVKPPVPIPSTVPEKSIAVLPFDNLSADNDNAFFTDGVQDEILTALAKIADLKIISRTSVMQYKSGVPRNLREIASQLSVANVVEGTVQRAGNTVRVTVQLINARTNTHLWADHFDRDLSDIFAIQSEIAQTIADQLRARLSPREKAALNAPPTTDLPAYDLYLRARSLYAESSVTAVHEKLPQAARLLEAAVARDPNFLLAWCLLGRVHGDRYFGGDDHTPERLEQAGAAVQTAARLQPEAGETHLAQADYYYHGFRDYTRARAELDLARRTLPNSAEVYEYTAYIDRRQGRWSESIRNFQRALELDPRNSFTLQQMALTYGDMHRYDEADHAYARALSIVPRDPGIRIFRAYLQIETHADVKPFQKTFATLIAEDPSLAPDIDDLNFSLCERTPAAAERALASYPHEGTANMGAIYPHAYWEGLIARWQGDAPRAKAAFTAARAEVEKVLSVQPDIAPAISVLGLIDAGLGRKEEAIAEGRRACELLPVSEDALAGTIIAVNLAQILAWTGEKMAAIDQIAAIEQKPNPLSYGLLKLHPRWDDLHGQPRFEALVSTLPTTPGF